MQYYIRVRGKAFGPFDENQLQEMKVKGKLARTTEISENRVEWKTAEEYGFLFTKDVFSGPPPQNPQEQPASQPQNDLYSLESPGGMSWPSAAQPTMQAERPEWFYSVNGTEGFGPVTASAIIQMLQNGKLNGESYLWQQGQNAQHLRTVSTFSGYVQPAVPNLPQGAPSYQTSASPSAANPFQQTNSGTFCSACGNPVVQSAAICPRCGTSRTQSNRPNSYSYTQSDYENSGGIGYFDVLKKYVVFTGRAQRKEYWNFVLINTLLYFAVLMVGFVLGFIGGLQNNQDLIMLAIQIETILFCCYSLYQLGIFLPSLAVCVRRLHDTGNSGWMIFLSLIPLVGAIILLVLLVQDSQPGDNQYGPSPKYN